MKDSSIGVLKRLMIISLIIILFFLHFNIKRAAAPIIEGDTSPKISFVDPPHLAKTRSDSNSTGNSYYSHRSHIRTFINGGSSDEFLAQYFDLIIDFAMGRVGEHQKPNIINLLYDYFGTMVPGDFNQKYIALLDYCDLHGLSSNDLEDMFLHAKEDVNYTLGNGFDALDPPETRLVPGWDPMNDLNDDYYVNETEFVVRANPNASARYKNESRIPIYYWGPPADYVMNIGNENYLNFIVNYYAPKILDEKEGYDGLFLDTLRSKPVTQGDTEVLEYTVVSNYTADIKTLLSDLKSSLPNGTIIVGNGWYSDPIIISGSEYENWARITTSIESAKLDTIIDRDEKGIIQLIQYNPIYDEVANPNRPDLFIEGMTLERDQLYSLALYYLVHGNYTYYGYGVHGLYNLDEERWFDAIDYDIGQPLDSYYIFDDSSNYTKETNNILINGDFEIDNDSDGNPDYWEAAEPVELDSNIKYEGNFSVKIESNTEINNINMQYITLESNTTYTLSGWIKTENVTGNSAQIYPYGFDDLQESDTWIRVNGDTDWTFYSWIFTTGSDTEGKINYRIMYGTGTAWFDDFHLTQGRYEQYTVFARDYQNATVLLKTSYNVGDNTTTAYNLDGNYSLLNVNGTLGTPNNTIELMKGEGAILIREGLNIITSAILPDGVENLYYSFNLTAIGSKKPIQWSLVSGSLPQGLTLDTDGTISGTPNESGEYSFIIEVSDAWTRTENKEFTLSIGIHDLLIDNIVVPKAPVFIDEEVNINATVYKIGNWTLGESVCVQLYIDNTMSSNESIIINNETEKEVLFLWTAEEGLHNIMIKVDSENIVIESNESNNIAVKGFYVYKLPDLWISTIDISTDLIFENDKIYINSTLSSYSELPLGDTIKVELLIDNQILYTRDLLFGNNKSMNVSYIWDAVSGHHEVEILVDSSDILKEANEDNNNKTTPIRVYIPPEVILIELTDPSPTKAGNVNFTITFNEDMDTTVSPIVTFGQLLPYNTYTITQSSYNENTWEGTFVIGESISNGLHRIKVIGARDFAGNPMQSAYISDPLEIDTIQPTSSVGSIPENQNSLTLDIPFTSKDENGSGIKFIALYYRIDSGGWTKYSSTFISSPISFIASGEGFYEFFTISTDNADNIEGVPLAADASTTVDTTLPSILSYISSDPSPIKAGTVTFTLTFREDMDTTISPTVTFGQSSPYDLYTIIQSSYSENTWTGTFAISNTTGDGIYQIRVVGPEDLSGNPMATAYISDPFEIDTTQPTSSVNNLREYQNNLTYDVPYTCDDLNGSGIKYIELYYKKDGGSWTKYNSRSFSSPISFIASGEGFYEFYTRGTDSSDNVEGAPMDTDASTNIDTTLPSILSIVLSDPSPIKAGTATLTIIFSEVIDTMVNTKVTFGLTSPYDTHEITESTYTGDTWTGTFDINPATSDGTYMINVSAAEDLAGNQIVTDTSYTFIIDTKPPAVASTTPTGTDIAITTTISVTFSETMDHSSTYNAFNFTDGTATRAVVRNFISWSGNTMTFTPDFDLNYGTEYIVTIGTGAEDLAGNGLMLAYSWSFTTIQVQEIALPTVDYLQIRDERDGQGNVVEELTFTLGEEVQGIYYCSVYNHTAGYLGERSAEWTITDGIGKLSQSTGTFTNFLASTEGTGYISANLFGIINSTGSITVNPAFITITLAAPMNVTVKAISSNEVRIEWTFNIEPDVRGYIIQRSPSPDGPWDYVDRVGRNRDSYIDTGLISGTTYYYRVIAVDNAANESPPSLMRRTTTHTSEEFSWSWLLIIIIILVLLILIFSMFKRHKPGEVPSPLIEVKK